MNTKFTFLTGTMMLLIGLTGCGTAQPSSPNQTNEAKQAPSASNQTTPSTTNQSNATTQQPSDQSKTAPQNDQLSKTFQYEQNGLATIEKDITSSNFTDAAKVADDLHNVFHESILPPLKDKKGNDYAEGIHGKFDELQDAIHDKNQSKITELIKVNRENLKMVAGILGVSLPQ